MRFRASHTSRLLAMLLGGLMAVQAHAASPSSYSFKVLGSLDPSDPSRYSVAYGINALGQVVGQASGNAADPQAASRNHAVAWSADGVIRDLGTAGGSDSIAMDINDHGQIVGTVVPVFSGPGRSAVLWQSSTSDPVVLARGPNSLVTEAHAINNAGVIVGSQAGSSFPNQMTVWNANNPGSQVTLGVGTLSDVSNSGVIVGASIVPGGASDWQAYVNDNGVDVSPKFASAAVVNGVNDQGLIIGQATNGVSLGEGNFPFVAKGGAMLKLGTLGGAFTAPNAINNLGQAVGMSQKAGSGQRYAVIWDGTQVVDLNRYLDPSLAADGWILEEAYDINDRGVIVGEASRRVDLNGMSLFTTRAFVLSPVPEASTLFMMSLGVVAIAWARKRASVVV